VHFHCWALEVVGWEGEDDALSGGADVDGFACFSAGRCSGPFCPQPAMINNTKAADPWASMDAFAQEGFTPLTTLALVVELDLY
jgi:hypothetical protein